MYPIFGPSLNAPQSKKNLTIAVLCLSFFSIVTSESDPNLDVILSQLIFNKPLIVDRDFFHWSLILRGEEQVSGTVIILREYRRTVSDGEYWGRQVPHKRSGSAEKYLTCLATLEGQQYCKRRLILIRDEQRLNIL